MMLKRVVLIFSNFLTRLENRLIRGAGGGVGEYIRNEKENFHRKLSLPTHIEFPNNWFSSNFIFSTLEFNNASITFPSIPWNKVSHYIRFKLKKIQKSFRKVNLFIGLDFQSQVVIEPFRKSEATVFLFSSMIYFGMEKKGFSPTISFFPPMNNLNISSNKNWPYKAEWETKFLFLHL
jgi:hypothetical protein